MLIGDSMLLAAGLLWATVTVIIKASPLAKIPASKNLLYQLAVSAVALPVCSLLLGEPGVYHLTPLIAGCIFYQVIWVAFITYLLWFWLIHNYPASRLSSFLFLTPIFGVLEGALLLHEPVTIRLIVALVLVCAGIYVVNLRSDRKPSEYAMTASDAQRSLPVDLNAFQRFFKHEVSGSLPLFLAAAVALLWANLSFSSYEHLWHAPLTLQLGPYSISKSVAHWIDEALMALFFFTVGLEIKYEVLVGELASVRKALVPVIGAVGGMLVPAAIYVAFNFSGPAIHGWGIPMATDIAFALAVLAVLSKRIPQGLKIFLSALAIADDIGDGQGTGDRPVLDPAHCLGLSGRRGRLPCAFADRQPDGGSEKPGLRFVGIRCVDWLHGFGGTRHSGRGSSGLLYPGARQI